MKLTNHMEDTTSKLTQDYSVEPLSHYLQPYRDKYRLILRAIEVMSDLTIAQKLALIESEVGKLKEDFKSKRKAEYTSKSIQLSVQHSCTSKVPGGEKDCGYKHVSAPNKHMFTQKAWISVKGKDKGTTVAPDGSSAGLRMTVQGKGSDGGTLVAIFKYRPESISYFVDSDTVSLFNQVSE